jgi:hypothetical protein
VNNFNFKSNIYTNDELKRRTYSTPSPKLQKYKIHVLKIEENKGMQIPTTTWSEARPYGHKKSLKILKG